MLVLAGIACLYLAFVLLLWFIWSRQPVADRQKRSHNEMVSVLIPCRNEEDNLAFLLEDLKLQDYSHHLFEVIVINDHSDDQTEAKARQLLTDVRFKASVINLAPGQTGKKSAIREGISAARGNIILTTDGDCRLKAGWIAAMAAAFEKDTAMACGPVCYFPGKSVFEKMLEAEFCCLVASGAVTLKLNIPSMCNGANLAYRKDAFFQVQGFTGNEDIMSGDDEFLMHKMYNAFPGKVLFLKNQEAIVSTTGPDNVQQLLEQRKRWAGKWKKYKYLSTKALAAFVFFANLSFVLLGILSFSGIFPMQVFSILLAGRFAAEYLFLHRVMAFFQKKLSSGIFLLVFTFYPLYVIFFAFSGQGSAYTWKGRKIKSYVGN